MKRLFKKKTKKSLPKKPNYPNTPLGKLRETFGVKPVNDKNIRTPPRTQSPRRRNSPVGPSTPDLPILRKSFEKNPKKQIVSHRPVRPKHMLLHMDEMIVPPLSEAHKDLLRARFEQATFQEKKTIERISKIPTKKRTLWTRTRTPWNVQELETVLYEKDQRQKQRDAWMRSDAWKGTGYSVLPTMPLTIPRVIVEYAKRDDPQRTSRNDSISALRRKHRNEKITVPPLHSFDRQVILVQFKNALESVDANIASLQARIRASNTWKIPLHVAIQLKPVPVNVNYKKTEVDPVLRIFIKDLRQYKKYLTEQRRVWISSAAWQKRGSSKLPIWPLNPFQVNVNASLQYPYTVERTTVPQNIQRAFNKQKKFVITMFNTKA